MRDVRSLVTEQTYIEGLTQAAEGAKLARNQLRCTKLADIAACEDAFRSKPDDVQLLIGEGRRPDAGQSSRRCGDGVPPLAQLKPGDDPSEPNSPTPKRWWQTAAPAGGNAALQ